MAKILHQKVLQLKKEAKPIRYGSVSVDSSGKLVDTRPTLKDRVVKGYLIIWNKRSQMGRIWRKGCCAKSIREHGPDSNSNYKIKFLYNHDPADVLALFSVLREDDTGLYFETKPLDSGESADRVLEQLESGSLNNFSPGWNIVWDKTEYNEAEDAIEFFEIDLLEGSIVGIPDELETFSIAGQEKETDIYDQTELFIAKLPKALRLEARHILSLQQSLSRNEPDEVLSSTLEQTEPSKGGLNYNNLINNLKIFK